MADTSAARASGDALTAETFPVDLTAAQASGLAMLADLAYGEQGETAAERDGYAAGQAGAEEIRRALAAFRQG